MQKNQIHPPSKFIFFTAITIEITHINYGNHMGNSAYLDVAHEARLRFLKSLGLSELQFGDKSLVIGNAVIQFKREVFHGDSLHIKIGINDLANSSFDLVYEFVRTVNDEEESVAWIKTGMICYDYTKKKIAAIPEEVKNVLNKLL